MILTPLPSVKDQSQYASINQVTKQQAVVMIGRNFLIARKRFIWIAPS